MEDIALYLELKGENPFRIAAFRKAAQGLERDVRSINEIDDFSSIPGIGKASNDIITEYINTGTSTVLNELKIEVPEGLIPLLKIPGLGGKRIATLYKELQVTDLTTLKEACLNGSILQVRGFGQKTVGNILQALKTTKGRPERLPVHYMLSLAEEIIQHLHSIEEISRFSLAGSLRRLQETIKDIDFIIETSDPKAVKEQVVKMDQMKEVIAKGSKKMSIVLADEYEVQVDFRFVDDQSYATTLHHFTGSKEHNVRLRQIAKERGEKINEYGVTKEKTSDILHFTSEEALFNHFDLEYIPPELRENEEEFERFKQRVPLVQLQDIQGDLHVHSTWSDGAHSIEEMIRAARNKGYSYIAITDHSKFLQVANGLNEERLLQQQEEIDRLNEKYEDIHIFSGIEMDILPEGELDFSDEVLQQLDWVIAAIHSGFNQTEEEIMNRLQIACENKYVNAIAHPTGRIIGQRHGYAVDVDRFIHLAKETNTALELNASPMRFDLSPQWLQAAQEASVPIVINTDAHQISSLNYMKYGIKIARKGWLQQESVVNTWSADEIIAFRERKLSKRG